MIERTTEDMCVVCNDHGEPSCGYEERGLQRNCPYNDFIERGYGLAEEDLGWHSVDDCLPEVDEEVIVLTDEYGVAPYYKISIGHIVNKERCLDYNGWNIQGVKFWMPLPEIPKEEDLIHQQLKWKDNANL